MWYESCRLNPQRPQDLVSRTCCSFDPYFECVYTGSEEGRLVSFCLPSLDRYTASRTHMQSLRQLKVTDSGVFALGSSSLRLQSRFGVPMWTFTPELAETNLHCMSHPTTTQPHTLLLAGEQPHIHMINTFQGRLLRNVGQGRLRWRFSVTCSSSPRVGPAPSRCGTHVTCAVAKRMVSFLSATQKHSG